MKKFIISIALLLVTLPFLSWANTNPFLALVKNVGEIPPPPSCDGIANPSPATPPPTDMTFCAKFQKCMIDSCTKQPMHPNCNNPDDIKAYISKLFSNRFDAVCKQYQPSNTQCITQLTYWDRYCPVMPH